MAAAEVFITKKDVTGNNRITVVTAAEFCLDTHTHTQRKSGVWHVCVLRERRERALLLLAN